MEEDIGVLIEDQIIVNVQTENDDIAPGQPNPSTPDMMSVLNSRFEKLELLLLILETTPSSFEPQHKERRPLHSILLPILYKHRVKSRFTNLLVFGIHSCTYCGKLTKIHGLVDMVRHSHLSSSSKRVRYSAPPYKILICFLITLIIIVIY